MSAFGLMLVESILYKFMNKVSLLYRSTFTHSF